MTKKILSVFLALVLILMLVSCSSRKGIMVTLEGNADESGGEIFTADFFYPEDSDIEVTGDEFYPNWKILTSESENFQLSLSLFENNTFDEDKEYTKNDADTYSEFKIDKYDAYGYEAFGGYYIYIHLEELSETSDRYIIAEVNRADFSADGLKGAAVYKENSVVQGIVNSLVYNGAVEAED